MFLRILLHETFPTLNWFGNEKLSVINPNTVAYIHALILDNSFRGQHQFTST
jgi:hypothetical protein